MPETGLYIENLDELLDILARRAPREFHRTGVSAITDVSAQVTGWVKQNSPVDTGRMRSSWHFRVQPTFGNIQGIVGTNVRPYPRILEMSNKRPRGVGRIPFLRPAVEEHRSQILSTIEKAFKGLARRLGF